MAVMWNWNGMELYKGYYIQYSTDDNTSANPKLHSANAGDSSGDAEDFM
jgi:hypothetical protein